VGAQSLSQSRPGAARFREILRGFAQAAGEDLASARDAFIRNYLAAGGQGAPLAEGETDAEQRAAAGLSLAGLAGGGGMAVGRAAPGRGEVIGMFLGRKAKHPLARSLAKWKEGDPMPPGTVMGPDGRPRIEISDVGARPVEEIYSKETDQVYLPNRRAKIGELLQHEDLLKAYPNLANIDFYPFSLRPPSAQNAMGVYRGPVLNPMSATMTPEEILLRNRMSADDFLNVILHELQHAVQYREGFPRGTSIAAEMSPVQESVSALRDAFRSSGGIMPENIRRLDNQVKDIARWRYITNLGEQEARAVSDRRMMAQDELSRRPPAYMPQSDENELLKLGKEIDDFLQSASQR
jgi:hypothetical protein